MECKIWVCSLPPPTLPFKVQHTADIYVTSTDMFDYRYIWFASNTIVFLFIYFFMPETRGRTLEEIHEMFEEGVPSRNFKGFICAATQAMATEVIEKEQNAHIEEIKSP